jgi:hypothetical protein
VTVDAFRSLKSVCYGFTSIIYELCERQDQIINLSKINQDINEKHKGNVCQEGGGTNALTQVHIMALVDNYAEMHLGWVDRGNCMNNPADQWTILSVEKQPPLNKIKPLRKLRSAGNCHK